MFLAYGENINMLCSDRIEVDITWFYISIQIQLHLNIDFSAKVTEKKDAFFSLEICHDN